MTASRIHLALAGLMGFAGVALLAAAAHVTGTANVATAGQMLLFHAAVIFGAAARKAGFLADLAARIALTAIILGAVLFAADLSRRGFFSEALFPRAAPTGGWLMLGGWLGLAGAALFAGRR